MSLTTAVSLTVRTEHTNVTDLSTATDILAKAFQDNLISGTIIDAADLVWADRRTLGATTAESLDLSGSMTDGFGLSVVFVKVKLILIVNRSATAANILLVGGAASNAWEGWTTVAGSKLKVGPGGCAFLYNPSLAAFAVSAGTGDLLKIDNQGASSTDYDIVIVGTSA